jgi:hypothetical protein
MRSIEEALSEVDRELEVRKRIYDGWVTQGKLSRIDAMDRLERLSAAKIYLKKLFDEQPKPAAA